MATGNRLVSGWVPGEPGGKAVERPSAFIGSYVLGKGFILTPEQAEDLIQRDSRNKDVLFPYLNGEDLNSRPDCSASRWVINFHDWSEEQARSYPEVFAIVERDVKPERLKNNRKVRRERWWQYAERAPKLYQAIGKIDRVLVVTLVSRTVMPITVPTGQIFSHGLGVFASESPAHVALLSSGIHYAWAIARASSLKGDLRYTPSDVYETLPQPTMTKRMEDAGQALNYLRRQIMIDRQLGLTSLYKVFHDPAERDRDVQALRNSHQEIDEAIKHAHGWSDLELTHGFHETRQGTRFLINPALGREVLDRLLELNHVQHEREVALQPHRSHGRGRAAQPIEGAGDNFLF
ncbi:type IIL restriction-modification enzyme MmeI [Streptomyces sp. NPDC091279]|uniref:type IIL restriction-modification enzyme MmeI n=1 Tax=Streptomyces sp. NPDC091279 TaxID=3365983 RepID=UPI003810B19B